MRAPPEVSAWANTEPANEKSARELAWQEFRSCRDCKNWMFDEEDAEENKASIGCCGHSSWFQKAAAFQVPEDYTCDDFEKGIP